MSEENHNTPERYLLRAIKSFLWPHSESRANKAHGQVLATIPINLLQIADWTDGTRKKEKLNKAESALFAALEQNQGEDFRHLADIMTKNDMSHINQEDKAFLDMMIQRTKDWIVAGFPQLAGEDVANDNEFGEDLDDIDFPGNPHARNVNRRGRAADGRRIRS